MKTKKLLLAISLLIILISLPLTVYLVEQRQELRKEAAVTTVLSLSPATATQELNQTFPIEVRIDTGENRILALDIELIFDSNVLEATDVTTGNFLPNPQEALKQIESSRVLYSLYTMTATQGSGTLATVTFKGIGIGVSDVVFGDNTSVYGEGEGQVLANTEGGTYTITEVVATPTPPPTGTPTPSPTPSPSPTSTPSPWPSPTPRRTPTPSPRVTPTPSPTPPPEQTMGDFNGDGVVDLLDFEIFRDLYTEGL